MTQLGTHLGQRHSPSETGSAPPGPGDRPLPTVHHTTAHTHRDVGTSSWTALAYPSGGHPPREERAGVRWLVGEGTLQAQAARPARPRAWEGPAAWGPCEPAGGHLNSPVGWGPGTPLQVTLGDSPTPQPCSTPRNDRRRGPWASVHLPGPPRAQGTHRGEASQEQSSGLTLGGVACSGQGSRPALLGVTQAAPEAVSFMLTVSIRASGASPRC